MAANIWNSRNQETSKPAEEKLFVFGYSCKIFRDDEKAIYIDQGKHMIPWMGDENLMIDRYDVRGYLHDLSAFDIQHEDEEISEDERLCDEERYLALRTNLTEEELYHEEEMKRLRAAVASDGAYHEISFSYDNIDEASTEQPQNVVKDEVVDEPYQVPSGLNVPKGMPTPSSMKIHAIIEKTALFVSLQGGQMEIIIKMKQSDNPQFAFMNLDNPLYPYYKHLVQEIKSGRYKPAPEKKRIEVEEDHHDGHYLHPSLVSGIPQDVPKFTVPSINFLKTGDDSYSLLVKNLKARIEEDALRNSPTVEQEERQTDSPLVADDDSNSASKVIPATQQMASHQDSPSDSEDSSSSSDDSDSDTVKPPPPSMQPVIDKMAEYVAKNGVDFETIVKGKNDKRFGFLQPGNKFYNYYLYRRNLASKAIAAAMKSEDTDNGMPPSTVNQDVYGKKEDDSPAASGSNRSTPEQAKSPLHENSFSDGENDSSNDDDNDCDGEPIMIAKPEATIEQINVPLPQPVKIVKGPISFSLKTKDNETASIEKAKKASLMLDDSDPEEEEDPKERVSDPEQKSKSTAHEQSTNSTSKKFSPPADSEDKPKKMSAEELGQKKAEEKIRDKLMAAARERLVQHKRDKQLQLERKQKAALFLQMLQQKKKADADSASESKVLLASERNGNNTFSPTTSEITSPERVIPISSYPPSPLSSTKVFDAVGPLSPSSVSSGSSNRGKAKGMDDVGSTNDVTKKKRKSKTRSDSKEKKRSSSKSHSKSHKQGHSKKRKRSRSKSPSHKHKRSSSKSRKEKKLPAAYANNRKSRSRSRSPRRYNSHGRSKSPLLYRSRWRQ